MGSFYYAQGDYAQAKSLEITQVEDLNDAEWLVLPGENQELLPLVVSDFRHTDQAVTAASDLLFHQRFSNELTTVGIHVGTDVSPEDDFKDDVGYLHVKYEGGTARPSPAIAFMGWMKLDLLNQVFVPSPLKKDQRTEEEKRQGKQPTNVLTAYKHSYIDALLRGRTLVIEIGHYRRNGNGNLYIAKYVEQWTNPDQAEAAEQRTKAIQARSDEINIIYPIKREAAKQAASNGQTVTAPVADEETGEVEAAAPQELLIAVVGLKRRKNLFDVPAGEYAMCQNGASIGAEPIPWDPTDTKSVFVWRGIAEGGFEVRI
jgi:hypothetical protein